MTARRRSPSSLASLSARGPLFACALLFAIASASTTACGPPPVVVPPPVPTATASVTAAPTATAAIDTTPKEPLPALHPCVPDFIQKELHACEPGADPADYNAVANAMAAMTSAGPIGPRPKEAKPVPRALQPLEEKAARAARSFLCKRPEGEPTDDATTAAFDLGRLYIGANHFEEAAVFLRDVVLLDPQKHAEVEYAARFLLDAVRALSEARPECADSFTTMFTAVETHVCKGAGADQRSESCAAITRAKEKGVGVQAPP